MERRVTDAELVHDPRPKALDDNVRFFDHLQERVADVRLLQIDRDRALAAIDREIATRHPTFRRRKVAHVVARCRVFDFDNVRAHICKHHRHERAW